jgi:hypothetical protein
MKSRHPSPVTLTFKGRRSEKRHRCPGCGRGKLAQRKLFCDSCWNQLPRALQIELYQTYDPVIYRAPFRRAFERAVSSLVQLELLESAS